MIIDLDALPVILGYAILFFVIYYLAYRRYIFSIFDPLFIYVFTISFASVLVVFTLTDKTQYLIHFFACHLFYFLGFTFSESKFSSWYEHKKNRIFQPKEFDDNYSLQLTIYTLFGIYVLANIIMFYTTGFAFLDDDPTRAKVENYMNGFGIILKINWGIGGFLSAGLLYLILNWKQRSAMAMLLVVVFFTALEGSKSSLLRILITFGLLATHSLFSSNQRILQWFYRLAPIGLIILMSVFFAVLFKENQDSEQAAFAFVKRLLYGADSILFFYLPENEQYFSTYHFWQYPAHLFNQILGFLRLVNVNEAMGNIMVLNTLPSSYTGVIVGPNTPYYIEGQVYFGYYGAFAYSFLIGAIYAFVRVYFFNSPYRTAFWFVLAACICQQAMFLSIEVTLFLTQAFDTCFFVLPVYVLVNFALYGKLNVRLPISLKRTIQ